MNIYEFIADELAIKIIKKIKNKVIQKLRLHHAPIEGGYFEDRSAWDVICVQLQSETSRWWYAYETLVYYTIQEQLDQLEYHEKLALWVSSDTFFYHSHIYSTEDSKTYDEDATVKFIREKLYELASTYTNLKIRRTIEDINSYQISANHIMSCY